VSTKKGKTGLVAFFDILGYKNIIENNDIEIVAEFIADELTKLPRSAFEDAAKLLRPLDIDKRDLSDEFEDLISHVSISDSILLTTHLKRDADSDTKGSTWLLFLIVCLLLTRKMFENGLPIRGAIGYGDYFVKGSCFAGMSIVEAYELTDMLELSGCVLTYNAMKFLKELRDEIFENARRFIDSILIEYLTPLKNCQREKLLMINFSVPEYSSKDISQIVVESFHGYNKDISESVLNKERNTEMMLRFFVARRNN